MSSRIYCYYPVFLRKTGSDFQICAVLRFVEQDHRLSLAAFPVIEPCRSSVFSLSAVILI